MPRPAAFLLVIIMGGAGQLAAQTAGSSCVACHEVLGGAMAEPVTAYRQDVHAARGFGCVACHGGDAEEAGPDAMDPARGFVGTPRGSAVLQVCGRCHSDPAFMRRYDPALRVDQVAEYLTSVHGRRLMQHGDTNVATCADCHPAHAIRPASDPESSVHPMHVARTCGACHTDSTRFAPYGIPTDQLPKYERSVHWYALSEGGDLAAPTCNDCHGNHGAAPPGVAWVGNVCGQCHAMMADLFEESRHASVFAMMGQPGCATCHGNHEILPATDEMLGLEEGTVCANCHTADDTGGQTARTMRALIDSLVTLHDSAHTLLVRAERAGVEVSQAQLELRGAMDALFRARAGVHRFAMDPVRGDVDTGMAVARQGLERGHDALRELLFRRVGLAVSVTIIVLLIVALLLKIRNLGEPPVSQSHTIPEP